MTKFSTRGNRPKHMTSRPIKVNYQWHRLLRMSVDYDPQKWKEEDLKPRFMSEGHLKVEDWTLDRIRRKYFVDLRGAKTYELERWMPKVILILGKISKTELISLTELALFFGMPKPFLMELSKRDIKFRRLVTHWRIKNLDMKADRVRGAVLAGESSYLEKLKPNSTSRMMLVGEGNTIRHPVDVGWKPKVYARIVWKDKDSIEQRIFRGFESVL